MKTSTTTTISTILGYLANKNCSHLEDVLMLMDHDATKWEPCVEGTAEELVDMNLLPQQSTISCLGKDFNFYTYKDCKSVSVRVETHQFWLPKETARKVYRRLKQLAR